MVNRFIEGKTMIFNKPFDIGKDAGVTIFDSVLIIFGLEIGFRRYIADENKWDDEESLDPFNELVSSMRLEMVFYAVSRGHKTCLGIIPGCHLHGVSADRGSK